MDNKESNSTPTAYLVDLVSNRKIPVTTPRCRVGRDDLNDIVISGDQSISRFHFIISFENNQYLVQDAKSRHGTFLNGNQISEPEPINDGDVLKIGVSLFWFVIEAASQDTTEPTKPVDIDTSKKEKTPEEQEATLSATQEIDVTKAEEVAKLVAADAAKATKEKVESGSLGTLLEPVGSSSNDSDLLSKELIKDALDKGDLKKSEAEEEKKKKEAKEKEEAEAKAKEEEEAKAKEEAEAKAKEEEEAKAKEEAEAKAKEEEEEEAKAKEEAEAKAKEEEEAKAKEEEEAKAKEEAEAKAKEEEEAKAKEEAEAKAKEEEEAKAKEEAEAKAKEEEEEAKAKEEAEAKAKEEEEAKAKEEEARAEAEDEEAEKSSESETLDKLAEAVSKEKSEDKSKDYIEAAQADDNGKESTTVEPMDTIKIPDWCKKYFSDELKSLNDELDDLNEKIRNTQERIKEIEGQTALTKGLRNTLLTQKGDHLIDACRKVLTLVGWKVTQSEEDEQELLLEKDDEKVAIARIIWTEENAERSHLGQLSISQTRYWCEKGVEPKGVLVVAKLTGDLPSEPSDSTDEELVDYAGKKNVCLLSTLQLLAVYRDVSLKSSSADEVRNEIIDAQGWLKNYRIEPGEAAPDDEDQQPSGQNLKSLLSV